MQKDLILSIFSLGVYIVGGLTTFAGVGIVILMKGKDLWGWGDAYGIGYLMICVGLVMTILGVLVMRVVRNRFKI
ncbi:hypothetical protein ICT70_05055 [Pelobacter sp. M08fum]|uniref:Uncharacterized protein n=2 Tax=Pelovirga terrestris TaxID=2771352 RepID=A0A8J6UQY5_9BACT|nr:hypothetical protein [Pelovirga terrestris]